MCETAAEVKLGSYSSDKLGKLNLLVGNQLCQGVLALNLANPEAFLVVCGAISRGRTFHALLRFEHICYGRC